MSAEITETAGESGNGTPSRPGTPEEAAKYIFEMLVGLGGIARRSELMFLTYLLEIAGSEAARIAERDRGGASRPSSGPS